MVMASHQSRYATDIGDFTPDSHAKPNMLLPPLRFRHVPSQSPTYSIPMSLDPMVFPSTPTTRGDIDALRLIHHFTISTCKSISDADNTITSWRDNVPQLAFEHDFLLSCVLAVTCLHLAILHPSDAYRNAALYYHTEALARFRLHLSSITPKNLSSVFAFACLMPLFSFGIYCTPLRRLDTLSGILEIFNLMKFIAALVKSSARMLHPKQFPQVGVPEVNNPATTFPEEIEASLTQLSDWNNTITSDEALRGTYGAAIDLMRTSFLIAHEQPGKKMAVMPFPIQCPVEYVDKLMAKDPLALAILAHYAVIVHWLRGEHIWMRGWGKDIVDAVKENVGDQKEWLDCIEWPMGQVQRV